jgi:hypothetical protein
VRPFLIFIEQFDNQSFPLIVQLAVLETINSCLAESLKGVDKMLSSSADRGASQQHLAFSNVFLWDVNGWENVFLTGKFNNFGGPRLAENSNGGKRGKEGILISYFG